MIRYGIILLFVFVIVSCKSIGPAEISVNRKIYNDISRESELEQLLKNIVRLRYSESTYFTKITSLTASYSLSSSMSASPNISYSTNNPGSSSNISRSFGIGPSLSYSDSPTISYIPVESAEFATQVQTPVTISQLLIPYSSGYYSEISDFIFIARIIFDSIGDLSNAATLVTTKTIEMPVYDEYYDMLGLIRDLRLQGALEIRQTVIKDMTTIHLKFNTRKDANSSKAKRLKKFLNVPADSDSIYLSESISNCVVPEIEEPFSPTSKKYFKSDCLATKAVHVELRSILQVGRFLSWGVNVPSEHIKAGYALELQYPDGRVFDTTRLMNHLFKIYSTQTEPSDTEAYVKTNYRNYWFYIKNSDIDSKITFTFLQRLMTLIAGTQGSVPNNAPVLTIPVGH